MIGRLHGTVISLTPPQICLDVHGVGYEVDVPMSTYYALPEPGGPVTLYTHLLVREDVQQLFGFHTLAERAAFRQLIRITGVGARMALAVLSGLSVQELSQAIAQQDSRRLTGIPGIGKKTAERLLLELKGKLGGELHSPTTVVGDTEGDILQALMALGYSDKESRGALASLPPGGTVSQGIKLALKALNR